MIHSIHLEGSLKSYLRECILWFALCKYDSHKRFLFCLCIYIVYIYFVSLYIKFCYFVSIQIDLTPQRTKLKFRGSCIWTEALINTWKCIQSRSTARVKIFQWKEASAEKKKQRSEQYVDDYIHSIEGISLFFHFVGFSKEMIKFTLKMFWVSWFGNTWCINLLYSFVIYFWKPVFALCSFCSL